MKKIFFTILCLGLFPLSANATIIDAHGSSFAFFVNGAGTGRAQGIQVNTNFSVSSIGILGDLISQSYDLVVYSSANGHHAGSVLASASEITGGTGVGWNNIALNFDFLAGNSYVVGWSATNRTAGWGRIKFYYDNALPAIIGPLTLVEGFSGLNAVSAGNSLHPELGYRVAASSVPEPAPLALLGFGLLGLGLARRRRG